MESFEITMAENVPLKIVPQRQPDETLKFDIYIESDYKGTIYPDHGVGSERFLMWRTEDNLDQYLVNVIGQLIEQHDA